MHEEPKVPQPEKPASALGGTVALNGGAASLASSTWGPWPVAPPVAEDNPGVMTVGKRANPLAVPVPAATVRRDTTPPQTARVTQPPMTSPGVLPAPPAFIGGPAPGVPPNSVGQGATPPDPPAVVGSPAADSAEGVAAPPPVSPPAVSPPAPAPSAPGLAGMDAASVAVPPAASSSPTAAAAVGTHSSASPWSNSPPAEPAAPLAPVQAELPSAALKRADSEAPAKILKPMVAKPPSRVPLVAILGVAALAAVAVLVYIVTKDSGSGAFGDPLSVGAPDGKRRAVHKPEEVEPEPTAEPEPPAPPPRVRGPLPQPKEEDIYDEKPSTPAPVQSGSKPAAPDEKYDPSGI